MNVRFTFVINNLLTPERERRREREFMRNDAPADDSDFIPTA